MNRLISFIAIFLSMATLASGQSQTKRYLYISTPDAAQKDYRSGQGILTRLKTIHIAKHLVGLAQIDLGHSLAGESHCLSDVLKNHLLGYLDFSFSSFFRIIPLR